MTLASLSRPSRNHHLCYAVLFFLSVLIIYVSFPSSPIAMIPGGIWDSRSTTELPPDWGDHPKNLFLFRQKLQPSKDNIIFVETSCASRKKPPGRLELTSRQACSIFSAAIYNPTRTVALLYTCPLSINFYNESSDSVKVLFNLPNFFLSEVDLEDFFANTPLQGFLKGPFTLSNHKIEHAADSLRCLAIYYYGGTYLDLDIVSLKPLDDLGTNFIVAQDMPDGNPPMLANGVFNFVPQHEFTKKCVLGTSTNYIPGRWDSIGPALVTQNLRRLCDLPDETRLDTVVGTISGCNITVWPSYTFYAIPWWSWQTFYSDLSWPEVKKSITNSSGAHIWNHMGSSKVPVGGDRTQPYAMLAEQHCYDVFIRAGAYFNK